MVYALPVSSDSTEAKTEEGSRMRNWAVIPVINYDRSLEMIFGGLAMRFFRFDPPETETPPSAVGAGGIYTTNETWAWSLFSRLHLKEDRYRVTVAGGATSVNFQFYFDLLPGWERFIDYNTAARFAYVSGLRETVDNFYIGLHYIFLSVKTEFDIPISIPGADEYDDNHGVGLKTEYDSRDNIYNSRKGLHASFSTVHYREWLGSEQEYNSFKFFLNTYHELSESMIMAGRYYSSVTNGDVPFYGQKIVGGTDIRGYSEGKYRGDQVHALQGELRWNFYKRWGMVAFAGAAVATDSVNMLQFRDVLPAGGVGIRFIAVPDEKINVGIDVAAGEGDWGLYFRIGEAF